MRAEPTTPALGEGLAAPPAYDASLTYDPPTYDAPPAHDALIARPPWRATKGRSAPRRRGLPRHLERHRGERAGWLRAAVLGANDGLVSTASLVLGVAAAEGSPGSVLIAGVAGLVAGAMSMAAGEYVSVHTQADIEHADLERERAELRANGAAEHRELAAIYVQRGLEPALATTVAAQLMAYDALGAHASDELGLSIGLAARPLQAALTSAASFAVGAAVPLVVVIVSPTALWAPLVGLTALVALVILGGVAAGVGGASVVRGAWRVAFWGAVAMAVTAAAGALFGAVT